MRIGLRHDREPNVELVVQGGQRNILAAPTPSTTRHTGGLRSHHNVPEATILEAGSSKVVRFRLSVRVFRHQDDRRKDAWDGSTGENGGPNDAVGSAQVVEEYRRPTIADISLEIHAQGSIDLRVPLVRDDRYIEHPASPVVGLLEGHASHGEECSLQASG